MLDPRKPMYLGFIDLLNREEGKRIEGGICNGNILSADLEEVMQMATDYAEDHGGETYIYRLVPIKRVFAKKRFKVEDLEGDGLAKDRW